MANSLIGIELEVGGVLLKFVQTAAESAGVAHVQEARYPVHSQRPPLHRHPRQDERFKIVEGALSFRIGDAERVVNAGEEIAIARGVLHSALNPGDVPAFAVWETSPALRTGEFFVAMGRATRVRTRPRLTEAAAILSEYRDEFQLAKPSPLIQRIVFGCLAPLGRGALRGIGG
jgi:mannose-6-phosphate isomerase-like protein (cupin superfamily)